MSSVKEILNTNSIISNEQPDDKVAQIDLRPQESDSKHDEQSTDMPFEI